MIYGAAAKKICVPRADNIFYRYGPRSAAGRTDSRIDISTGTRIDTRVESNRLTDINCRIVAAANKISRA
jgi:hypothetical protein